jgi:hypothetical protein
MASKYSLFAAILLALFGLLCIGGSWWLAGVFLGYAALWGVSAVFYIKNYRWAYYACIVFTAPWLILFCTQFFRRIYYLVVYGGELPDGTGSPMAFIVGFVLELPFTLGLIILTIKLIKDWKWD